MGGRKKVILKSVNRYFDINHVFVISIVSRSYSVYCGFRPCHHGVQSHLTRNFCRLSMTIERRHQRERQKNQLVKISNTTTLHVHHAFLYISLPSLHDYDVKIPNFTFFWGCTHKTTTFFFFSRILTQSVRIQRQKKIASIWRIRRDGISAIKFEAARLFKWRFP